MTSYHTLSGHYSTLFPCDVISHIICSSKYINHVIALNVYGMKVPVHNVLALMHWIHFVNELEVSMYTSIQFKGKYVKPSHTVVTVSHIAGQQQSTLTFRDPDFFQEIAMLFFKRMSFHYYKEFQYTCINFWKGNILKNSVTVKYLCL